MVNTRRAQIAIFFVLFAIIVVSLGIWWMASRSSPANVQQIERAQDATSLLSVSSYVEQCLSQISPGVIKQVGQRGGRLSYPSSLPQGHLFQGVAFGSACIYQQGKGCVNSLPTKNQVEQSINEGIALQIPYCLNLTPFYAENKYILFGNASVDVKLGTQDAVIGFSWPIEIRQRAAPAFRSTEKFSITLKTPLGYLYDTALDITNRYIRDEFVDLDDWMLTHGSKVIIRSYAPYPDWLFVLQEGEWQFNFALIGKIRGQSVPTSFDSSFPACLQDELCYENVQNCQGSTIASHCPPSAPSSDASCPQGSCNDCVAIGKSHGQSWCDYEGFSGFGADKVGSRHVKQSCIDGKVITQSCRDFREEVCVQSGSKAVCRDNRWEDCSVQSSQNACEDTALRDCVWKSWAVNSDLSARTYSCVPHVPPGLKFWDSSTNNICNQQNTKGFCPLGMLSCPNQWSDADAVMCFSQGDCGDSQNFLSQIGRGGFQNSDYMFHQKNTSEELLLLPSQPGFTSNLHLPLYVNNSPTINVLAAPSNQEVDQFLRNFVEIFSSWKPCNDCGSDTFKCNCPACVCFPKTPLYRNFRKYIAGGTTCNAFVAPQQGDCSLCDSDPFRPCSQYRCKSIGRNCLFAIDKSTGDGKCSQVPLSTMVEPLVISHNPNALSAGYQSNDALFVAYHRFYQGVRIAPLVYTPEISYGLKSSDYARCTVAPLPAQVGGGTLLLSGFLPVNIVSNGTEHNITLTALDQAQIVSQINTYLNSSSVLQLINQVNTLYGINVTQLVGADAVQLSQNLLNQAAARNFYLFHHCVNEFGVAANDFFVQVSIP